ncbi:uncharacterized protein LOC135106353 isoform X1 [Scylla paramamosain]|uniref:uncharacterized protein LOC135106353 isoform X1 n=1 Tax=Scylla paramamosain TaxID=85552 RepID=UPI003083A005
MTSHNRASFSTRSIGQGDLDLQPVRETKMRVLNDIPKEPVVPPPPPQVKFNFVDVSFPGPPERECEASQSHHRSVTQSPKKRTNAASERERSSKDQVRYDKENSFCGQAQRNMQRDRQEYLSKLLRRGVPVWEEVPEEERAAKVIGGTNPFRHHPYSSSPLTSNITHRNTNKQKSSKMQAVWEDVKDSCKNSYPLEHNNTFIDSPRGSTSEGEEICLKSKAERLNKILRKNSHVVPNTAHDTPFHHQPETLSSREDGQGENVMLSEAPCQEEVSQMHHTNQEHVDDTSCPQESPHQDNPENLASQDIAPPIQSGHSLHENENPQDSALVNQERPSRPVMKKIYGGRIDNDVISSVSWWPGDKLYKERNKNEEEEKHEKESTKEKNGKRDLSTSQADAQKKRHAVASLEEVEKLEKPQPRVRRYEVNQVRKYMKEKQCERSKTIKELQKRQEQEKIKINERMKELAIKTKQLSQANKKSNYSSKTAEVVNQKQNQLEQQSFIDWSSQADAHPWVSSPKHIQTHLKEQSMSPDASHNPISRAGKSMKQVETEREISKVAEVSQSFALDEKEKLEDFNVKKRSKKDNKRRKKRRSLSDSEAISDIVSRTVEECERQVKSSSVSVESLSSLSSFSCSSSDVESRSSQSESLSSDLDLAPKERALALGQLAQKLTSRVTQETSNLTHREKQNKDVTTTPRKATSTSTEKHATRRASVKSSNIKNCPRTSLSLSQIEKMSVEELIAKMTAMLPNKFLNEGKSNVPQADHQGINRNLENQEFECNTQNKTRNENMACGHTQDTPARGSMQGVLMEQLPKLVVPDVPKLRLSGAERKVKEPRKIAQHEDLSMLPGHNVVQCGKDLKFQTDEEKQVFVKMTPTHRLQHRYVIPQSESYLTGRQLDQSHLLGNPSSRYLNISKKRLEHAATVIQATYRGYRVRKITNVLISQQTPRKVKDATEIKSVGGVPSSVVLRSYRLSKNSVEGSNDTRHKLLSKEGREQVNWKEVQSVLESKTLKPHKESYYISQRSDLPRWIQPYFVLSETGDVKNFLETQADNSGADEGAENDKSSCMINSESRVIGTQNHPHSDFEKPMHNVTLTEGPLSDLEKETVSFFNKETQTSYNRYMNVESKRNIVQEANEAEEFVDLKKLSKEKALTSQNRKSINNIQKGEMLETSASVALDATQSTFSQRNSENTLEEGLIEEALKEESSFQALENGTLESGSIEPHLVTEEGPPMETSGITDLSNDNTSALVEEVSAPHELLGEGVHIGPASLRLRLNAELMYQDTLGKALNELHNVEQLNILNRSRQEAMALSQSLALQQQKAELTAHRKTEDEVRTQEEETKRREDYERRLKEKLKQQEEALQKVEKTEREARSRFAELEREVRARAEQMIAQATERIPQPSSAQSDVIAAAAVAAVGATISQWKQLRPVSGHKSHGSVTLTEESVSPESASNQNDAFSSKLFSDEPHPEIYSVSPSSRGNQSAGDKTSSLVSEKLDENLLNSSVIEEQSASRNGAELEINSTQESVPESIASLEGSVPTLNQQRSVCASSINESISLGDRKFSPKGNEYVSSISEKIDSVASSQTKVSSDEVTSASNLVPEDILYSKTSGTVTEAISKTDISSATKNNETDIASTVKSHFPTQKSSGIKDHKKQQMKESVASIKNHGSPLMSLVSKSKEKERKKEERDTSDIYSESFEVDSENENSNTLSSQFHGRTQGAYGGDLALVVSSGNILNDMGYRTSAHGVGGVTASVHGGGESALGVTLSVVESLLKEEEVHHQHQKALLKLQEQSLVEEARWKLATLQSEGGPGIRRRQRVIVLQLREQKAYLRRLRETQNIGAQQRKLMLMQLHHLLGTTTNLPGFNTKSYLTTPRGQSPNPGSPRLTPRVMEMYSSSSSDAPEDMTLNLLMRGRDSDSTSPSESGGGREKRRSHSEDRQKIVSGRLHEKRRTAEIEALQQQLLYEDKEILRLKAKSSYDIHDKDSVKPKRKGDFITKRSREKKEKHSGSVSPHAFLKQGSRTSTDSSVPPESIVATIHNSQSSVHEEVSSEVISHSDVTSSVSEQEGLTNTSHRTGNSQSKEGSGSKRPLSYAVSERKTSESHGSKTKITSSESETIKEQFSGNDSKSTGRSSSSKTVAAEDTTDSGEKRLDHDKSERNSRSSEKSSTTKSEVSEKCPESQESSIRTKFGSTGSAKSGCMSNKSDSLIPEDITDNSKTRITSNSSWCSTETRTDSGTKSSDIKSVEGKSCSQKSSTRGLPLPLKVPLSPRSPHRQHRRYSSESDDSFTLSQTETASDMSDGEGKLLALKEELAVRRAEAERLKKEKRRLRRERLASQERALRQQISTYDAYIQHARMELEKESKELQQASMVRPLIKKPQVAETKKSRLSESFAASPEKSDHSDVSLVSEGSKSDHSSVSKSLDTSLKEMQHVKPLEIIKSQELHLKHMGVVSAKEQIASSGISKEVETKEPSSSSNKVTTETVESQRENESEKTSLTSSISESLNEESVSEHTEDDDSSKKSLSQDSSVETDPTQSQASSTETIVHSPQKLESSQKDDAAISMNEVNAALLEVLKDNYRNEPASLRKADNNDYEITDEGEKKLEIYIPTSDLKSSEAEDFVEGNTNTSAEQSICEEVLDDFEEAESEGFSQKTESSKDKLLPVITNVELEPHKKNDTSYLSSLSENKEPSLKTESTTEVETSTSHIPEAKEIPSENESRRLPPTPDRQRLVDDISNNILAVMMKETNQLFTNIVKDKVGISKSSETASFVEVAQDSTSPEVSGKLSEPQRDGVPQCQHSSSSVPEEDSTVARPISSNKSEILQRVNELIGEGGSVSQHLSSINSPRSENVQLTPQMTFDLSSESSSPVSPITAKPSKVERDKEAEQSKSDSPAEETTIPSLPAAHSKPNEEEEHDSLSPSHDIVKAEEYKLDTETLTDRLLNLASVPELELEARLGQLAENTEFSVEGIEGNWFDDDFWKFSDNKKKQQQLKAEEERITAEIARLEELQHLQQKYPGLIFREVPDKPPPPYTPPQVISPPTSSPVTSPTPVRPPAYSSPPASPVLPETEPLSSTHSSSISHRLSKADQRRLAAHVTQVVPITEDEALPIIDSALDILYEAWHNNIDPGDMPPPPHTVMANVFSQSSFDEGMHEDERTSTRAFHLLLFCLAQELLSVPYKMQNASLPPPWMKQALPQGRMLSMLRTKSHAERFSHIREQVKVLFGWKPPLQKESLMIRWAQKHRDLVDQVLVKELQAEEASWTNYDEDEAAVKTKVANEIFDALLSETVALISSILVRKLGYIAH